MVQVPDTSKSINPGGGLKIGKQIETHAGHGFSTGQLEDRSQHHETARKDIKAAWALGWTKVDANFAHL